MTATPSSLLNELADYVTDAEAPERCGVVMESGELAEIANIHPEPTKGFHMDPGPFLLALEGGAIATWHTHQNDDPNLSEEDMAGFLQWPWLTHFIVGVRDGEPTVHAFKVEDGLVVTA